MNGQRMDDGPRQMRELSRAEAMRRLGSVPVGRVVFTRHALPAVRPVNHLVDGGQVIISSHEGSAIVTAARAGMGTVVAYEADEIDPACRTGWSVVVTGLARLVGERERVARYQDLLQPWAAGHMDSVISIDAQVVTGFELIPDESPAPA
ncbi:MAG: pyridoxamine 5'-phosphate oxidase family protein [Actinobacteria bacterium]|nr:pyridoxamine 5'-phosphate oxidase family protein [Actinomycetota bacterium]